jgi:hypothetical protein
MGRDEQTNKKQNKQTKIPSRFRNNRISFSLNLSSGVIPPPSSLGVGI